jgi:hypothetical protein
MADDLERLRALLAEAEERVSGIRLAEQVLNDAGFAGDRAAGVRAQEIGSILTLVAREVRGLRAAVYELERRQARALAAD